MSLVITAGLALAAGALASFLRLRAPLAATVVGLAGLAAVAIAAAAIGSGDVLPFGSVQLVGSDLVRAVGLLWAVSAAGLVAIDALGVGSHAVAGPALLGIGAAILALGATDGEASFAFLAAGGVATVVAPAAAAGRARAAVAWRALRVVVIAGLLGLGLIAWESSPAGPLSSTEIGGAVDPAGSAAIGLALIAIVAAVALRSGAIPTHVWAARLVEAIPMAAIPAALAWGGASFALVASSWAVTALGSSTNPMDLERTFVGIIAAATLLLGSAAAFLHDDVEHVVGYSIVADAGVVLLAFVALDPAVERPLGAWVLGYATVTSGLAGWAAATRGRFGVRRLPDLRGWARRSPLLGVGLLIVLVGAIGIPGTAANAARARLISLASDPPFEAILLAAVVLPIAVIGRLLAVGWQSPSQAVADDPGDLRFRERPLLAVSALLVIALALVGLTASLGAVPVSGPAIEVPQPSGLPGT
jgi:formate hydrogenlyase subunit 3/multisubunit Na+/H+ antiporter MnhD subunit